jgi:hypothetical protein
VVEKRRANNDLTHVFKANGGYEFPFGSDKRWINDGFMSRVLGGLKLTGIFTAQSGRPLSFVSARGTLNRTGRSGLNTVNTNLTIGELQSHSGLFFDRTTGAPLMFHHQHGFASEYQCIILWSDHGYIRSADLPIRLEAELLILVIRGGSHQPPFFAHLLI